MNVFYFILNVSGELGMNFFYTGDINDKNITKAVNVISKRYYDISECYNHATMALNKFAKTDHSISEFFNEAYSEIFEDAEISTVSFDETLPKDVAGAIQIFNSENQYVGGVLLYTGVVTTGVYDLDSNKEIVLQ